MASERCSATLSLVPKSNIIWTLCKKSHKNQNLGRHLAAEIVGYFLNRWGKWPKFIQRSMHQDHQKWKDMHISIHVKSDSYNHSASAYTVAKILWKLALAHANPRTSIMQTRVQHTWWITQKRASFSTIIIPTLHEWKRVKNEVIFLFTDSKLLGML